MKKYFTFFVAILFLFIGKQLNGGSDYKELEVNLRHAKTYYWLGISDKGDPQAFQKGILYLQKAESTLISLDEEVKNGAKISYKEAIASLKTDLYEQLAIAVNNHAGVFPLIRFVGESPLWNSDAYGSFEIANPPNEVATIRGVNVIGQIINKGLWGETQLPVIVFSENDEYPEMESLSRAMFKHWPRVKVFERSYFNSFLNAEEIASLIQREQLSDTVLKKINQKLGVTHLAIVNIKLNDKVNDVLFYNFIAAVYANGSPEPIQTILHFELIRDKRYLMPWILLMGSFFILASVFAFYVLNVRFADSEKSLSVILLLPVAAWLTGVVSSMIVSSFLGAVKPGYQEFISYSFWYVPVLFLLLFFAAVILTRKLILISPWLKEYMGASGGKASLYIAASFGISTVIGLGLILYHELQSIPLLFAAAYFLGLASYAFGRAMDKVDSRPLSIIIPFVLLIPVASVIIAGRLIWPAYVLLFVTVGLHFYFWQKGKLKRKAVKKQDSDKVFDLECKPSNIDDFSKLVDNPPFFETGRFKNVISRIEPFFKNKFSVLCLYGKAGIGKTATANEVINRLNDNQLKKQEEEILVIKGSCEESTGGQRPYAAIRSALTDLFDVNPFDSAESQIEKIDSLLDGAFKKFVPFSGLILPEQNKNQSAASTQHELFYSIALTIKKLSEKQKVVFYIDDIHWLDEASIELIKYLHGFFKEKDCYPVLFLYTSRPDDKIITMLESVDIVELTTFTEKEYFNFLTKNFYLDEKSARLLMEWTGDLSACKGNLFWLLKILDLLARGNHLVMVNQHFALSDEILASGKLPVPDEYRLSIREELKKFAEYKNIIKMACVIGIQFDAELISRGLEIDKLRCLEALHTIESESNLVYDVSDKDGIFAFQCSFTLETIRTELGITDKGQKKQIIKEYNAIIASLLEELTGENFILRVANHYYNAGHNYAQKNVSACIRAANYCVDIFRYDSARRYLEMAEEKIAFVKDSSAFELELAVVKICITTSEGKKLEISEDCCLKILDKVLDITPIQLSHFAHFFYHVRNYSKVLEVSNMIIDRASTFFEKATGLNWKGLCLPNDAINDKIDTLKQSLAELEKDEDAKAEVYNLKGQILNSLGEQYSRLAEKKPSHKNLARDYFLKSIDIKNNPETYDSLGLARSYGGLGRLEVSVEPVNAVQALEYFEKDLELSVIVGDYKGKVKMYSFIGACHLKLNDYEKAAENYNLSLKMSTDALDTFFALLGLLELSSYNYDKVSVDEIKDSLADVFKNNTLPDFCATELKSIIDKHPQQELLRKEFRSLLLER